MNKLRDYRDFCRSTTPPCSRESVVFRAAGYWKWEAIRAGEKHISWLFFMEQAMMLKDARADDINITGYGLLV